MFSAEVDAFRFDDAARAAFEGQRVFITGASRDGGIGQAFALAAALNGAEAVGVHFHRSYQDGFDLVAELQQQGVNAFPVQADVTNPRDLWACRSYVIEQLGGLPPSLVICNSGLTESGYSFGRALRPKDDELPAMRRARVRQHFIDSLDESRLVLNTKIDGFMGVTHLWAGEAVHHQEQLRVVYVSSRQAIDPGPSVPGYAISNWAVLQLPKVLSVNLGKMSNYVSAFSVLFPFVRTSMTDEYADNEKVFGRWQPRMLETHECAEAFSRLLSRPDDELNHGMFELTVNAVESGDDVSVSWQQVQLKLGHDTLDWSASAPGIYGSSGQ